MQKRLLRREEAAQYVQEQHGQPCSPKTLAKFAVKGGGPAYRKAGRVPLYDPTHLDEWCQSRLSTLVHSTSELSTTASCKPEVTR